MLHDLADRRALIHVYGALRTRMRPPLALHTARLQRCLAERRHGRAKRHIAERAQARQDTAADEALERVVREPAAVLDLVEKVGVCGVDVRLHARDLLLAGLVQAAHERRAGKHGLHPQINALKQRLGERGPQRGNLVSRYARQYCP